MTKKKNRQVIKQSSNIQQTMAKYQTWMCTSHQILSRKKRIKEKLILQRWSSSWIPWRKSMKNRNKAWRINLCRRRKFALLNSNKQWRTQQDLSKSIRRRTKHLRKNNNIWRSCSNSVKKSISLNRKLNKHSKSLNLRRLCSEQNRSRQRSGLFKQLLPKSKSKVHFQPPETEANCSLLKANKKKKQNKQSPRFNLPNRRSQINYLRNRKMQQ